jgi:hypothetical protein
MLVWTNAAALQSNIVSSSIRLRYLPELAQPGLRVFVFLPTDGNHVIARFARRHDNAQLILCS